MNAFRTSLIAATLAVTAGAAAAQPAGWALLDGPHAAGLRVAALSDAGTMLGGTYTDVLRNAGAGWSEVAGAVNGSIHDVATAAGGRVWAGTSGILRSDDGGQTWQWFSIRTAPHSGTNPTVLHVAQGPDGTVYAGGYRSHDAGATWPQMSIYAYATAFIGSTVWAGTQSGVHRSVNSGNTWVPSGLDGFPVSHMAATGTRLLAATTFGIVISDDGENWIATCTLPDVSGLAVSGDGAVWASSPVGLFRSPDGQSWPFEPTAFTGQDVRDVAANGTTLLAIVEGNPYRSTDNGSTWEEIRDGLGLPFATSAFAEDGVLAVSVNGAGPFRSTDAGAAWSAWPIGLSSPAVNRMIAMPTLGLAFAHSPAFIYRATLDGGPWTAIPLPEGLAPAGAASDGTTLFAVAEDAGFVGRIFRSPDGASWEPAHTEDDAFMPQVAAGGGVAAVSAVGFVEPPRLLISNDGGQNWASRPHPTAPLFGFAPPLFADGAGRIYVQDGNRLVRSDDLGVTWTTLGMIGLESNRATSLHSSPGVLCVGTTAGVWCSTDDGATFAPASAGLPGGGAVHVVSLVRDAGTYFALTADDGVFASDAVTAGAPAPAPGVLALTASPNPTTGATAVNLTLPAAGDASVAVFDALGRRVAVLHDGPLPAGRHTLALNAATLPAGAYAIRAFTGAGDSTQRIVVLR